MNRHASAVWKGGLKDGQGLLTVPSKVLVNSPYSFDTRFENQPGTNPEELIAAAHASCYAMALSGKLGEAGMTAESIQATATVTLDRTEAGPTVTKIHLDVTASIPNADPAAFEQLAKDAKENCPISRLLKVAATITLDAKLEAAARK